MCQALFSFARLLLVYYKRPGAVFKVQKSFSDRTEAETERRGITEHYMPGEKSPLLAAIPGEDYEACDNGARDVDIQ